MYTWFALNIVFDILVYHSYCVAFISNYSNLFLMCMRDVDFAVELMAHHSLR